MRRRSTVRWLIVAGMGLVALILFWHIPRTLTAFALGGFIAFGLFPIVEWMVRRGLPRWLSIGISYLLLVGVIAVLAVLIVPATLGQIQALAQKGPEFAHGAQAMLREADTYVRDHSGFTVADANLQQFFSDRIGDIVNVSALSAIPVLLDLFSAGFITLTALVLSAFFLSYGKSIAHPLYDLLSPRRRPQARLIGLEIAHVFGGFVVGQVLLSAIVAALSWAGCFIVGFSFALLVGVISGIAYAVPFVGQIAAHAIALILAGPQGFQTVVLTQVALFIVFRIADNIIAPRVFAGSVGVSPVVVIFAVFAGGELFGLPGLLLAIPTAALVRVLFKYLVLPQLDRSRDLPTLVEEPASPAPSAQVH
jgi:predicted PurR-regulated permease PerM